jgi:hypothetical protein
LRDELPEGLVQLDRDIADLVDGYLTSIGVGYTRTEHSGRVFFEVRADAGIVSLAALAESGMTMSGAAARFATGDARGLTDAQPLNLLHPLVKAAIASARAWPGGSVELMLPPDAAPELHVLAGHTGVLAVALADYAGFEPVQRLVAGAVAGETTIDPATAAQIARLPAADGAFEAVLAEPRWLDDAMDEAAFVDQREVEEREQQHFEQAMGQLERFVDDKVLVCRRERAAIAEKLRSARIRRDEVVGSTPRDKVEAEIQRLAEKDETLERRAEALDSREDEVYRRWRNEYHDLRYRAPAVTRLFQVSFRIVPATPGMSC